MKLNDFDFRVWDGNQKQYVKNNIILAMLGRHRELVNINNDIARNTMFDVINSDKAEIELYTRFKDKNGKKIYEGDIVKFKEPTIFEVCFEYSIFSLRYKKNEFYELFNEYDEFTIEVIGNIHENLALLQTSQNE